MEEKLKVIHYLMVVDVAANISLYYILKALSEDNPAAGALALVFQITIYGAMLLFMATAAGIIIYMWKVINREDCDSVTGKVIFPKTSFVCSVAAFLVFSIFWMF